MPSASENLNLELRDANGDIVPADFEVYRQGELVNSSSGTLDVNLSTNKNYTVKQSVTTKIGWYNVTFYQINMTRDFSPENQIVNTSIPPENEFLTDKIKTYAVSTDNIEFGKAGFRVNTQSQLNRIAHCLSFDFQSSKCDSWNINGSEDYSYSSTSDLLEFNTTSFDGYAAGATAPYPNITDIEIYDVSDSIDNREGGELVASGLNKTFRLAQHSPSEYRFEFRVYNNGSETWTLDSSDILKEEGLDPTWTISDIWYEIENLREGGTFSNGDVSWDTGKGGSLDVSGSGDELDAAFVLDLGLDSTVTTQNTLSVEETSSEVGSQDQHQVKFTDLGDLNVTLNTPPNETVVSKGHYFNVNATVECEEGYCGQVYTSPRYNATEGYNILPEGSGTPFYTNDTSKKLCGSLSASEECYVDWDVNATGELKSWHRIDINATSNYTEIPGATSAFSEVQINEAVIMDITWDEIDFGYIAPGERKAAAGNEDLSYNVTIDQKSVPVDGVSLRGNDLVSVRNDNYSINISNVSMKTERSDQTYNIGHQYSEVIGAMEPGSSVNTKYWLDAPLGITAGSYLGNLTFRADATQ